jgi:hypothetical protein
MISSLSLHLSKYGCQGVTTAPKQRAPLQERNQEDRPNQSIAEHDCPTQELERMHTPKLDMKKISAATKKVLNQQLREMSQTKDLDEALSADLPSTPQSHCTQLNSSSPETPVLSRTNLNYFQVLRSKPTEAHPPPRCSLESPEMIPELPQTVHSSSSTPEPHTPDLAVSLNTTTLMRSAVLIDQKVDLCGAFESQGSCVTPERSFLDDSDRGSESEDDLNEILNLSLDAFSPPKTSKILQPRKIQPGSHGWIPSVTDKEWLNSPAFLQRQVTLNLSLST